MDPSGADADEAVWVASATQGDTAAFAQLFHRYYPMIHAFAYRCVLRADDAEEIAQETFIKAARALPRFRGEASFKSWLYRIAMNAVQDCRRRGARQERLQEAVAGEAQRSGPGAPADFSEVREALAALPEEQREAVALVYYEGLNHAEAARACGCAETTISWRLWRAKKALRAQLEKGATR